MAMVNDFKEEVRLENEKKKLEGNKLGADVTNGKAVSLQLEAERDRSLNTDRQIAKKVGVGTGTVARYNKVMNSNEEDLKEKVKTGRSKYGNSLKGFIEYKTVDIEKININTSKIRNFRIMPSLALTIASSGGCFFPLKI